MRGITGGIVWRIILWIMLLNFRNLDLHCPPTLLAKKRTGMILTMLSKLFQPMCMLTSLLLLKVLLLLLKIISRTQGSLNSRPIVCLELLNFKCDVNNWAHTETLEPVVDLVEMTPQCYDFPCPWLLYFSAYCIKVLTFQTGSSSSNCCYWCCCSLASAVEHGGSEWGGEQGVVGGGQGGIGRGKGGREETVG